MCRRGGIVDGCAAGGRIGSVSAINLAFLWRDLKSDPIRAAQKRAVSDTLSLLRSTGEFDSQDIAAAAALCDTRALGERGQFDPSLAVVRLADGTFVDQTARDLVDMIDPGEPRLAHILLLCFTAGLTACEQTPEFRQAVAHNISLDTLKGINRLERMMGPVLETIKSHKEITEFAIIQIAKRIAAHVSDIQGALAELDLLVDTAERIQARGATPSNHPDFVDQVFAEVARCNDEGDVDAGASALTDAISANKATQAKLFDALIEQHTLRRDAMAVAQAIADRVALEHTDPMAAYDALWNERRRYDNIGLTSQASLPLEIAIALAQLCESRAPNPEKRAGAQNSLGNALVTLGAREEGSKRLEAALTAYEGALGVFTRKDMPIDWAMTQMNLGAALRILGAREEGTARLEAAVIAYERALMVYTRKDMPTQWGMTQMNLGAAFRILGER